MLTSETTQPHLQKECPLAAVRHFVLAFPALFSPAAICRKAAWSALALLVDNCDLFRVADAPCRDQGPSAAGSVKTQKNPSWSVYVRSLLRACCAPVCAWGQTHHPRCQAVVFVAAREVAGDCYSAIRELAPSQ